MSLLRSALLFAAFPVMAASFPNPEQLPVVNALPDPLITQDGTPISTGEQWRQQRVPELRQLFQYYEYGYLPAAPARVEGKVVREEKAAFGGKATLREVTLTWGAPEVAIHLLLVVPNAGSTPAPVFLGLNFTGNHTVVSDPKVQLTDVWMAEKSGGTNPQARETLRGKEVDTWNIEATIDRGYAVATFFNGDVIPDEPKLAQAALARFRSSAQAERGAADAGTIAAWAWCLMRAVDYLVTDPAIDAKRIAVVGHSRNGKSALVAAAFDERIALAIPSQAGCGGSAPCRVSAELGTPGANGRSIVETVGRINTAFPHWFCGNFQSFNQEPARLPFDQHALIALCAPRPVLLSCATEDLWANPSGQFDMLRAADPAYRLVAGEGVDSQEAPPVGKLLDTRLGYFIRPGKHSMTKVDWEAWLTYADKWLR